MGWERGTYGIEDEYIQCFGGKAEEREYLENLCLDGIIL